MTRNGTLRSSRIPLGFTLTEMLVVLAIIAVITGILLPVVFRSREMSRRASCLSNQRQIGMALLLYAQDSNECLPASSTWGSGAPMFWPERLTSYVGSIPVFLCPDDDHPNTEFGFGVSYAYNDEVGGILSSRPQRGALYFENKGLPFILKPASTVMLTDSGAEARADVPPESWTRIEPSPIDFADAASQARFVPVIAPYARHMGMANVLFVDGHTKALRVGAFYVSPGQTASGESVPGFSPCLSPERGCP